MLGIVYQEQCPTCVWSGTINVLQVTDDDEMRILYKLLIKLEFEYLAHRSGIKFQEQL